MRRSWRDQLRRTADVAVPIVVGLYLFLLVTDPSQWLDPPLTLVGTVAAVAQGAALWWRRSRPALVMLIALAGGLVVHLIAPYGVFPVAALIAMGSLAATRPPRVSLPALAALLALTALNFFTSPAEDARFAMAFPVVVWALGESVRNRRVAIEQASRRAVGEEQARIARELHDVIAHSVSVIIVQAGAADHVFDAHPDQARAALRAIEAAGRDALEELRPLLAAVRPSATAATPPPRPGLDRLAELAAPLRTAGLEVAVRREDSHLPGSLPSAVDLSAYRIIQEALTNTLRHAGARRVEVTVRAAHGVLELEVCDDGRAAAQAGDGAGRGIAGMRERAALLGGTFEAGPLPQGGFRVHARLPLEAAR